MSAISRLGSTLARTSFFQHQRHMASASTASDPVQKLFLDKIKEFKTANKGLDESHQKNMKEEMARLKRVFKIDDDSKVAQLEFKFSAEENVSLRDLDEQKKLRESITSGEYQKQLEAQPKKPSALLATIPEQVTQDLHLPPLNKPDMDIIFTSTAAAPAAATLGDPMPDYQFVGDKMTPHRLQRDMGVMFGPEMPTINDDKSPERDVVNFPRNHVLLDTPPSRHHFIPESWFQFFYPKTGVTGPYAFATTFGIFLFSKEWLVMEHEMLTAFSTIVIFTYAVTKFGPKISSWGRAKVKEENEDWEQWRKGNIQVLKEAEDHFRKQLNKKNVIQDLYEIRKQDLDLQLEAEYRRRVKTVYDDTRRRLNYLVAVADSKRQIAFSNMVNYVISNAVASFGPKQESEVLDNCITNLKQLASKNANVI